MDLIYFTPDPYLRAMFLWLHEHAAEPITLVTEEEHLWLVLARRPRAAVVVSATDAGWLRAFAGELRRRHRDVSLVVLTEGDAAPFTHLPSHTFVLPAPGGPQKIRALLAKAPPQATA